MLYWRAAGEGEGAKGGHQQCTGAQRRLDRPAAAPRHAPKTTLSISSCACQCSTIACLCTLTLRWHQVTLYFALPLALQQGSSQLASPCRQPDSINMVLEPTCYAGMWNLLVLQACAEWTHVLPGLATSGTRDFLPEDLRVRQWLFGEFEAVARLFGFEQFETPVLESEALFTRKAGDEITQQLYNFEARCALSVHKSSANVALHSPM